MAIRICLRRVKPRQAALGLGFLALRGEGGGGAFESKVLSDKAARHLVKVAPLEERRENTVSPPAEWWELVRKAARGQTKVDFAQTQKVLPSALRHVFQDPVSRPRFHRTGK